MYFIIGVLEIVKIHRNVPVSKFLFNVFGGLQSLTKRSPGISFVVVNLQKVAKIFSFQNLQLVEDISYVNACFEASNFSRNRRF